MKTMSFLRGAGFAALLAVTSFAFAQILPTGATITPGAAPGSVFVPLTTSLPDFPVYTPDGAETTAISPDGKTLLILTSGYNLMENASGDYTGTDSGEFVFVYDISTPSSPVETQVVFLSDYDETFDGIVWAPNGSAFYVGGGGDDNVHTFTPQSGAWAELGTPINLNHYCDLMCEETETGPTAAILGIAADGKTLFVANHETDSITSVDLVHGAVLQEYDLRPGIINPAQTGVPGGEFPYGIAVVGSSTAGNGTVYVSSVRDREIDVLSFTGGVLTLTNRIPVAGNPERMTLNAAQTELFVVAANSDELIIIDTASNTVVSEVNTSAPVDALGNGKYVPKGSNPNSVTLSPDETAAYVTNGGTNSVAVVSLTGKKPVVAGLIPTGWYPNSVSVSPDGSTLYVVNSKSVETPNPLNCRYINNDPGGGFGSACQNLSSQDGAGNQYAWQNEYSGFLTLPVPSATQLATLTGQVAQNNGFNFQLSANDIATMTFLQQHIKHVIYIVKENRTFDQILGDLTNGANADPAYTQFPASVTPNFHNFANNFVTFDNFDDSSMVSMDGWQWSTAARALDVNEKCVKVNYGKGGCQYDSEGTARNINVAITGVAARQIEQPIYPPDPNLLPGNANEVEADGPTGEEGAGYIWDAALKAHLTVRNYGFYTDLGALDVREALGEISPTLAYPCSTKPPTQVEWPAKKELLKLSDLCFWPFDQSYPDFFRYAEWAREFDQQVKHNTFPNLVLLRYDHDHFGNFGTASFGVNTPELQIADDDYAVGLTADKIAHSPYANNTLIFVIEDDPQDGADHVSGDRSLAFIVGPYVKQGAVVSDPYSTVSMLRTIEEVLGLPPLGVHDAGVPPMTNAFNIAQAGWTYSAIPSIYLYGTSLPILNKYVQNPDAIPHPTHDAAWWAAQTKGMDFSKEDRIPTEKFNRILWKGMMGGKPYPALKPGKTVSEMKEAGKNGSE
ncbi:MAG: bifunctional YncE family protein/alkaline phosphatase family protein [Terriglobales bacterium]|jgi:DNA-binding beta-propeller fold protein YncE